MSANKFLSGSPFPPVFGYLPNGQKILLSKPRKGFDWKLIVVYRGHHCHTCFDYLTQLEKIQSEFLSNGIDIIAVSADTKSQLEEQLKQLKISYPIAYGLSVEDMKKLGLYISEPMSAQETDHLFAEPALFVLNSEGKIQTGVVSSSPFARPDLVKLASGLKDTRDPAINYPIRGTYKYI